MELSGERAPEVMSDRELVHALDQADADLARIETRRLRLVAALDKSGYAEQAGARDTVQYLEYRYRLDHYRARRDVQLANALPKYPAITAALPDITDPTDPGDAADPADPGDQATAPAVVLRPAQAEAIVTALEKVPATVAIADLDVAEHELVRLARHLPPAELRKAAEQARDILDTDGPEPEEHKASARENLTLTTADRGVKFKGYLANENAELLRSLIITGARPHKTLDGQPDPRTREKRQADALTTALTLAATALDTGTPSPTIPRPTTPDTTPDPTTPDPSTPDAGSAGGRGCGGVGGDVVPGFGAKANITVTIDLQDLKAATADAIGDTVHGPGLSAATIRRLACDAKIIPIVLGSNSEPLDVGRTERLVTRPIRRALNTRDRGCVVCGAPPIICDAHHLISWIDGGDTTITNLALLCRRHHTDLHNGHWNITITNGQVHVTRPTWADPPPRPNRPQSTAPPDRSAAGDATAGHLRLGADGGSVPPDGSLGSVPGDSVAPAATGLMPAASDARLRDDVLSAENEAAAVRDATYLAIWGERPPAGGQAKSARGCPDSSPFDPWGESGDLSPATTAPDLP
jgi:hypothetical protein